MNSKEVFFGGEMVAPAKKHKKHKHKKHRKRKAGSDDYVGGSSPDDGSKIIDVTDFPVVQKPLLETTGVSPKKKKPKGRGGNDSETSEEEQRWLDAIQEGKLEEVEPELKNMKTKDPKLMTARQRAMLKKGDVGAEPSQLVALPSGYREKVMTPEMMKKAEANKEKMRKLHDEKRAKEKKRTLERLLRKQEAKGKANAKRAAKRLGLTVKLVNRVGEIRLSLPPGVEFPLQGALSQPPPPRAKCAVQDCGNDKRYSCSKTNQPLCSLQCYKKNLALFSS